MLDRRYAAWRQNPAEALEAYRARCATIGQRVRVHQQGGVTLEGTATEVGDDGTLRVATADGAVTVAAGDVVHLRPL